MQEVLSQLGKLWSSWYTIQLTSPKKFNLHHAEKCPMSVIVIGKHAKHAFLAMSIFQILLQTHSSK